MTELSGKRAIVSGASLGIGRGIAVELARAGATVAVNYRSNPDQADEVVAECKSVGGDAFKVQADVSVQEEAEAMMRTSIERLGGLDIVVSNAAYSDRHLMLESDMQEFRKTIDVSMWGAFYVVRSGAAEMVKAGKGGNIVVISSPHAHLAMPGAMAYNMAKAANDQMARTAACELAQHRIRCNIIHPGWINTPGERKFFSEETLKTESAKLPMKRLGEPKEIGRGVVFLCREESEYITGSTLTIDGGIQLPWRDMFRVEETAATAKPMQDNA
ncbi:SDR family NAD(P)-dependent oxidoreductase [Stieleria sp.]|uniref:SDR family NAD(P)-dependent oxidoreductase n=1 Tax=Stieleria sp. TaxID=2795976 RepID=UPI0035679C9D